MIYDRLLNIELCNNYQVDDGQFRQTTAVQSTTHLLKLIFSVFKTLTDQRVTVELKNDLSISGVLKSVDQCVDRPIPDVCPRPCLCRFLNIRLDSIKVLDETRHPHMVSLAHHIPNAVHISLSAQMAVKNCFIRGSVVRYVQLPAEHVDTQLLEDATRRGGLRLSVTRMMLMPSVEAANQAKR